MTAESGYPAPSTTVPQATWTNPIKQPDRIEHHHEVVREVEPYGWTLEHSLRVTALRAATDRSVYFPRESDSPSTEDRVLEAAEAYLAFLKGGDAA